MKLEPADIVLVHGLGWLSRSIRFLTQAPGERSTWVSHCGIAVGSSLVVEALSRGVVMRQLAYPPSRVRVYRPKNVSASSRRRIALAAELYVGRHYGWTKLLAHGIDGLLGGAYLARRLVFVDSTPICSYVVAAAYESEGLTFGVDKRAITPDDIIDFCSTHHDKYERVYQ